MDITSPFTKAHCLDSVPVFGGRGIAALVAAVLLVAGPSANAADVLTKVTSYGTVALPFTTGISGSVLASQVLPTDWFVEDYRFTVADGTFSSVSATFNLFDILQVSNLSARLLTDLNPLSVYTAPATLTLAEMAQRNANTLVSGVGSGSLQTINPFNVSAGSYILEVRGNVTGTAGGSYGGVFNIAAVPEPSGLLAGLLGLGVLGWVTRRRGR